MTEPTLPSPSPLRGGALDLLRFLAVAFVVLYHFGPSAPVAPEALPGMLDRGWLAADVFLVLSAYVLARVFGPALDEGRTGAVAFFARRLGRVWPAHGLVLAGFALLLLVTGGTAAGALSPPDFISQLALTHAWGFSQTPRANASSWMLSALIVCYAAFPLVWRWSSALHGRVAAVGGAVAVLAAGAALSLTVLGHPIRELPAELGVLRAIPLFLAGLLLARFVAGATLPQPIAIGLASAAAGLLVCLQAAPGEAAALVSLAAVGALIMACDSLRGGGSRLIEQAARLSFPLFITHALSGAIWFGGLALVERDYVLSQPAAWAAWAGAGVFALAMAWVFHRLVDAPLQAWLGARLAAAPVTRWTWPVRGSSTASTQT